MARTTAKVTALVALVALLGAVAVQGAAAFTVPATAAKAPIEAQAAEPRSLLGGSGSSGSGGIFSHCLLNGGRFPHHGWFDRLQCCNGVWTHNGCNSGSGSSQTITPLSSGSQQQQAQPAAGAATPSATTTTSTTSTAAASGRSNRKLLSTDSTDSVNGFRFCEVNGRRFEHFLWFSGLQCCNGSWFHGGCSSSFGYGSSGHCLWQGTWYPVFGWYNGFQCCSGSWRHGGCS